MRRGSRRFPGVVLLAVVGTGALLAVPASVSANSDPHRFYEATAPLDVPVGYCAFVVHLDFTRDREYGTLSTLQDGSTVLKTTGSLMITATNSLSGKTLQINAGGPGTSVTPPSGSPVTYDYLGRTLFIGTNLTDFGLPSNLVAIAGPVHGVEATNGLGGLPFGTLSSLSGSPKVITDVCGALS